MQKGLPAHDIRPALMGWSLVRLCSASQVRSPHLRHTQTHPRGGEGRLLPLETHHLLGDTGIWHASRGR